MKLIKISLYWRHNFSETVFVLTNDSASSHGKGAPMVEFQAPVNRGQKLPLPFSAWRRKAVLAGGIFYSCLFSAKNNHAVSWKHQCVMETNVFCFSFLVGGSLSSSIRCPAPVLVDRTFLVASLWVMMMVWLTLSTLWPHRHQLLLPVRLCLAGKL